MNRAAIPKVLPNLFNLSVNSSVVFFVKDIKSISSGLIFFLSISKATYDYIKERNN